MASKLKKIICGCVIAGSVFGISLLAFSEDGKRAPDGSKGPFGGDMIVKMKDKLSLSDDQVSKLKALYEDSRKNNEGVRKQVDTDIKAIRDKVKAGGTDSDFKVLLDALHTDEQKMMDARKAAMDQIKTILTPTQQAKMVVNMRDRMEHWGKKDWKHGDNKDADGKDKDSEK